MLFSCAPPSCGGASVRRRSRARATTAQAPEPRAAPPSRDEAGAAPLLTRRVLGAAACAASALCSAQASRARPVLDERLAQRVYEEGRLSAVRVLVEQQKDGEVALETLGSGIVWDQRGHAVVNYHCISRALGLDVAATAASSAGSPATASASASSAASASGQASSPPAPGAAGARSLRCVLLDPSSGAEVSCLARLVAVSRAHDLAVLLLPDAAQELLTPVPLGSLATLRVGQSAFAVGLNSLSYGVVSGLRRPMPSPAGGLLPGGAVLTDATIDPANSGSALLDSSGRMMGLCTNYPGPAAAQLRAGAGRASSLGFAVPVDTVRAVVPQLIAHGRVVDTA